MEKEATRAGTAAAPRASGRRPRLLIIDDEPLIGRTLEVLLGDRHDVVLANSGDEAKRILATDGPFDAILCDLMMPLVNGMQLHQWLAETHPELAPRMVFMTGGVYVEEARDFLARVPNLRIEKPFDHLELAALLSRLATDS